jgi:hypothetical protein
MKFLSYILIITMFLFACNKKEDPISPSGFSTKGAVLIVNEGNYNWQNGSVSLIYPDSNKIVNDAYKLVNAKNIGDVPQSAFVAEMFIYIVVNNSGKIVKLDRSSFKQVDEIDGLVSPRFMQISGNIAYVSDLYASAINVLDVDNMSIVQKISAPKSTEQMLLLGDKLFVSNWSKGNKLLVLDSKTNEITDSISLTLEPESMVLDKNNSVWVLCSGGFNSAEYPALYCINTDNLSIQKELTFSSKSMSPQSLAINSTRDTLYYLNASVYQLPIESEKLNESALINANGRIFYGLGVSPQNEIWVSDASNFVENSEIYVYGVEGDLIKQYQVGVNASHFYFGL